MGCVLALTHPASVRLKSLETQQAYHNVALQNTSTPSHYHHYQILVGYNILDQANNAVANPVIPQTQCAQLSISDTPADARRVVNLYNVKKEAALMSSASPFS
jgi:hypothetical protein